MSGVPKQIRKQLDRNKLSLGLFGVNCSGGLAGNLLIRQRIGTPNGPNPVTIYCLIAYRYLRFR